VAVVRDGRILIFTVALSCAATFIFLQLYLTPAVHGSFSRSLFHILLGCCLLQWSCSIRCSDSLTIVAVISSLRVSKQDTAAVVIMCILTVLRTSHALWSLNKWKSNVFVSLECLEVPSTMPSYPELIQHIWRSLLLPGIHTNISDLTFHFRMSSLPYILVSYHCVFFAIGIVLSNCLLPEWALFIYFMYLFVYLLTYFLIHLLTYLLIYLFIFNIYHIGHGTARFTRYVLSYLDILPWPTNIWRGICFWLAVIVVLLQWQPPYCGLFMSQ